MTQGFTSQLPVPLPTSQGGTGVTNTNWTAASLTFSPTTQGIVGTTTNDSAGAGYVGEFISSTVTSSSPVSILTNTSTNLTSISLTAGDWDLQGNVRFTAAAGTPITGAYCWISSTSATLPADHLYNGMDCSGSTTRGFEAPFLRISIASTTTIYISGYVVFGSSTVSMVGGIYARRVR